MTNNSPEINAASIPVVEPVPAVNPAPVANTPPPANPPPVAKKRFPIALIFILLIIVTVIAAGTAYYLGANGKASPSEKEPAKNTSAVTPVITKTAVLPTKPLGKNPTSSSSGLPAKKTTADLPVIPGSTVYTSEALGIRFRYADAMEKNNPDAIVHQKEIGNKIYLYVGSAKPESGQYVEVLKKDKADSIETAITKQFLKGIDTKDCFVKIQNDKKFSANFAKAVIAYPMPTDSDQPYFATANKCPQPYTAAGGIAYFLSNTDYPEKLLFFSIGQYAINAETGKIDSNWQDTVEILK